jgi:large repetitive protein
MSLPRRRWPLFAVAFAFAAVPALHAPAPAEAKPAAKTTSTDATFSFRSSEPDSTFHCALDGAAFAPCSTPIRYTGLARGEHEFRVRAIDRAGNMDPTPARYRWTIEAPACGDALGTAPGGDLGSLVPDPGAACDLTFAPLEGSTRDRQSGDKKDSVAGDPPAEEPPAEQPTPEPPVNEKPGGGASPHTGPTATVEASPSDCSGVVEVAAADADAWISESFPDSNKGADSRLAVDTRYRANARALVRFALPELPTACQVKSATLRLYSGSYAAGRTLQAVPLAGAWAEGLVNWTNQPGAVGEAAEASSRSSPGYVEWNVTSQVLGMYTSTNNGFLVRDGAEDGAGLEQSFNSREQGFDHPPQLIITYG